MQSESSAIIDDVRPDVEAGDEDEPVKPEPASPEDSAKARHQELRTAIYGHWSMPRPADLKIEMRGLLNEFGWDGGLTLGDWMLGLELADLEKINEAVRSIP